MDPEMAGNVPPLTITPSPVGGKRSPHALNIHDLNPGMHAFLSSVKKYFTQKINLERQKAALCAMTYDKAQERILSTYNFSKRSIGDCAHVIAVNWDI